MFFSFVLSLYGSPQVVYYNLSTFKIATLSFEKMHSEQFLDRLNLCCCYLSVGVQLWPMKALELAAHLLALFVGQRLCINFFVSSENFLITLRSHFNVTCSFYFWLSLLNVDVNYSCFLNCIEKNLVKYNYFGSCWLFILNFLGDKWVALVLDPHLRRRCTKSKKGLVIGYSKQPWTSMIKVDNYDCSFS